MRRRRFMKLMAAGAVAAAVQPLRTLAAPPKKKPAVPDAAHPSSEVRSEIASQTKALADTLKVIRSFELEPGSRPAFVFRAEKRRSRPRAR